MGTVGDAFEAVEYTRELRGRDADPLILNREARIRRVARDLDVDG